MQDKIYTSLVMLDVMLNLLIQIVIRSSSSCRAVSSLGCCLTVWGDYPAESAKRSGACLLRGERWRDRGCP